METISQREFAKRVGLSEGMIRKCIKTGKLIKGVTRDEAGKPSIIYELAKKEIDSFGVGIFSKAIKELKKDPEIEYNKLPIKSLLEMSEATSEQMEEADNRKDRKEYNRLERIWGAQVFAIHEKRESGNRKKLG